ncbi:acyltransferase family protein [Chitinophaga pinensis]|uniref:Acyltransferase n=1 Tax=Chitinophaga pinensis TaxID=79329 RepID=A0A5C6LLE5_9BACT|nr:acyltransferase [Chitinophaga pinensis]TWV94014.1 acyltransferase [Chitinophaga pinensis]
MLNTIAANLLAYVTRYDYLPRFTFRQHMTGTATTTAPKGQAAILQTRQHFEILDGLRGVAAVFVVFFHFMEVIFTDATKNFAGHGFLAVDFFFCLSGFVIAYAYDNRIEKIGIAEFFKSRLIRLHPLVILGTVLGLLAFLFNPFAAVPETYTFGRIALIVLASMLMIPLPVMSETYFNLFGLNAPSWSLFWEYAANIIYGTILWRFSKKVLLGLLLVAAIWLIYTANKAGNLLGGWSGGTFLDGGARLSYSFLAGLLVYRYNFIIRNKLGFPGMAILLLLALLTPVTKEPWLIELALVMVYFPLLVALGAGAQVSNKAVHKVCDFAGKISYPLYMTHYMVIWIFANYYNQYKPGPSQLAWVVGTGVVALVGFAYLAMVCYDIPVRKYLTERRKLNRQG